MTKNKQYTKKRKFHSSFNAFHLALRGTKLHFKLFTFWYCKLYFEIIIAPWLPHCSSFNYCDCITILLLRPPHPDDAKRGCFWFSWFRSSSSWRRLFCTAGEHPACLCLLATTPCSARARVFSHLRSHWSWLDAPKGRRASERVRRRCKLIHDSIARSARPPASVFFLRIHAAAHVYADKPPVLIACCRPQENECCNSGHILDNFISNSVWQDHQKRSFFCIASRFWVASTHLLRHKSEFLLVPPLFKLPDDTTPYSFIQLIGAIHSLNMKKRSIGPSIFIAPDAITEAWITTLTYEYSTTCPSQYFATVKILRIIHSLWTSALRL